MRKKEPAIVEVLRNTMEKWLNRRMSETKKPDPILGYQLGLNLKVNRSIMATRDYQAASKEKLAE